MSDHGREGLKDVDEPLSLLGTTKNLPAGCQTTSHEYSELRTHFVSLKMFNQEALTRTRRPQP